MTDIISPQPPYQENPDEQYLIQDAAQAAQRVIGGGEDDQPRHITTPMEREMIRGRADDAVHEQALRERNQELHSESRFDEKTKLPTEKVLNEDIIHDLALAFRSNGGVVLLEIDGNGLKAVNDEHGSLAGDHLLQRIAAGIKGRTRKQDRVYRRNGGSDEFYVLAPFIRMPEDGIDEFFTAYKNGIIASVQKEIDRDEQLGLSPQRGVMGVSVGVGSVDFGGEAPKYEVMSTREVADQLLEAASLNRLAHKEALKTARNQARIDAGREIPNDDRLQ